VREIRLSASSFSRFKAALMARLDPGLGAGSAADRKHERFFDLCAATLLALLEPFSILYGAAVVARASLYRRGTLKTYRPPCATVCVGNITTGGTGKTPAVVLVCRVLQEMGMRVVVLSRGYGRSQSSMQTLAPGDLSCLEPEEASSRFGDEVLTLATRLEDVPIIVTADRATAAKHACDKFAPDVLVMDDGFGHLRLERDLDILMFDAKYPFANRKLLPCGTLREPLWAIARARVAIISRSDQCGSDELAATDEGILRYSPDIDVIHSTHRPAGLRGISDSSSLSLDHLSGKSVLAFCGIARPESFFSTLSALGAKVTGVPFPDHHAYTRQEIKTLLSQGQSGGFDLIVTTDKDAARLAGLSDEEARQLLVLRVELALLGQDDVERLRRALAVAVQARSDVAPS